MFAYFDIDYRITFLIACVIFGIYCIVLSREKGKQNILKLDMVYGIILSAYMALLISCTMLARSTGEEFQIELLPFWSYRALINEWNGNLAIQNVNNIFMFVPWGILYATVSTQMQKIYWNVGSASLFSILIEVIQLIFRCGLFEFDDMYHNTLGAAVGYGIWRGIGLWKTRRKIKM